jgi:hypothetical protein
LVEGSPYPKTMNHENKKRFICLDTIKIQVVATIKNNQLNVVCPLPIPTIRGPQVIPKIMSQIQNSEPLNKSFIKKLDKLL